MENAWFKLLDWLDGHGVPVYAVVTPLEDAGVPTLWLTIGVVLILFGAMAVTLSPQKTVHFKITALNGTQPLQGATITIGALTKKTPASGVVEANVPYGDTVTVTVKHPDCELVEMTVPAKDDYTATPSLKCAT